MEENKEKVEVVTPELPNKLTEEDRFALEAVKHRKALALKEAEKAIAQNEAAEATYKVVVLQIAMKYNLKDADVINDDGSIVRK
jgi:hypothetical protein